MEYEILEGVKVSLTKITPRALKRLKEIGVDLTATNEALGYTIVSIYTNEEEKIKSLLDILFNYKCENVDELDIEVIQAALRDFFGKLSLASPA